MKEALPDRKGHSLEAVTFRAGLVAHFRYNSRRPRITWSVNLRRRRASLP